ncbi:hypothetical protein KM043_004506 [Ampulex compressa]|nr:hypothetical protein KM043_004506 [Ampulex compressa]
MYYVSPNGQTKNEGRQMRPTGPAYVACLVTLILIPSSSGVETRVCAHTPALIHPERSPSPVPGHSSLSLRAVPALSFRNECTPLESFDIRDGGKYTQDGFIGYSFPSAANGRTENSRDWEIIARLSDGEGRLGPIEWRR